MHNWKWIKGALLLGIAFFLAALFVKPIGVSTQFSVASGIIHSALDTNVIQVDENRESGYKSTNAYYDKSDGKLAKSIKHPLNYDFIFVLAIPLGALAGYLFDKGKKQKDKQLDTEKTEINLPEISAPTAKTSFIKKYLPSFLGGFLILFGARMADGCTSGHMFSGMMQGSVSGFIFAASVFLTAIPVARYLSKYFLEKEVI
jgi:uncharacterized membrane protein YedE/YeeE